MKRLLLIDATAYLFRAYHVMKELRTKAGRPSGAIFGTLNMLRTLRRRHPDAHIACVLDAPGRTFRHEMYAAYKATRPPTPPEIKEQIEGLCDFLKAWGLPLLREPGVEADDVIATYARQGAQAGMEVIIASSDKDLMQLVEDGRIQLYDGMKEKVYDSKAVQEKYGVPPAQMGDYLALMGDTSDNIPGVMKVGPKTAAKWLAHYRTLAALCEHAGEIKGAIGNNLRAAIADGSLKMSRQLVALKDDMQSLPPLHDLQPRAPHREKWRQLCMEFEFRNMQELVDEVADAPASDAPALSADAAPAAPLNVPITVISEETVLAQWAEKIRAAGCVAVDTETVNEPVRAAKLVGISLSVSGEEAAYIPIAHSDNSAAQLTQEAVLAHLAPLLQDERIGKIMHNGKYDYHIFANEGVHLAGVLDDTKIAAYCHDPSAGNTLDKLAQTHLGIETTPYKALVDGKQVKDFAAVAVPAAAEYSGEDAWVTHRLHTTLQRQLTPAARRIYEEIDRPLMPLLARIEHTGMKIDAQELSDFAADMRGRMDELEEEAHYLAEEPFNLNSPRQLEQILFDKMGAKPLKKTGSGARSTNERTLEQLSAHYPLAKCLLEYRMLAKLVGTYAEKLPQEILPSTGRIHTNFSQTAVSTGRLSSSSPNLQNIPIKTEYGRRIRRAFIADKGKRLLSADYSQIELRIMAHIAADDALCAAFAAGADIHRQTAAEVFGSTLSEVSDAQRRAAKAINFGLIYGMSAYGLARTLDVEPPQAQTYIDRYFSRYPQVAELMQKLRSEGLAQGYVETIVGRRIPLAVGVGGRPAAERFAINAPIQGSAADIMKQAMLAVEALLQREQLPATIILQVHDELVLEVAEEAVEEVRARLLRVMSEAAQLSVRLEVEAGSGANWDEAH